MAVVAVVVVVVMLSCAVDLGLSCSSALPQEMLCHSSTVLQSHTHSHSTHPCLLLLASCLLPLASLFRSPFDVKRRQLARVMGTGGQVIRIRTGHSFPVRNSQLWVESDEETPAIGDSLSYGPVRGTLSLGYCQQASKQASN